ncbi:MAG: hypothetical protein ACRECR_06100 [Thermoplasmata archaeon]
MYDTATLTGFMSGTSSSGGTVSYYFFAGTSSCPSGTASTPVGTVTVSLSGTVPNSVSYTFNTAGPDAWQANYSGNANNNPAVSPCEPMTVIPASPTINTTLSSTSIQTGGSVHDAASLTGAWSGAGGSVTYEYFPSSGCAGVATPVSTVAVTGAFVPNSASHAFATAGAYGWRALYSGDANDGAATSPCEPLTVSAPNVTRLTTTLSSRTTVVGSSIFDTAALSNVTTSASGTVSYEYSQGATCSGSPTPVDTVDVVAGLARNSTPVTFSSVGSYGWQATYSGDLNNRPAISACELLNITKASPRITTNLTVVTNPVNATLPIGCSLCEDAYDTGNGYLYVAPSGATAVDVLTPSPLALVTTVSTGASPCAVAYDPVNGDVYVANSGSNSVSVISGLLVVGTISVGNTPWAVGVDTLNGDVYVGNHFGASLSVISGIGVIATVPVGVMPDSIAFDPVNGNVYVANVASSTVSVVSASSHTLLTTIGVGLWPSGVAFDTVNHDIYVSNLNSNSMSVISGATNTVIHTIAGLGMWPASVTFDPLNHNLYVPLSANAVDEISGVTNTLNGAFPATTISYAYYSSIWGAYDPHDNYLLLTLHDPSSVSAIYLGYKANDTAHLLGATAHPTGTVTYYYFTGTSCSGTRTAVSTVSITSALAPVSSVHFFPTSGYSWDAAYGGDANNNPATSACEPLIPPPPHVLPSPTYRVTFAMDSGANLLVTDPQGREAGFLANGTMVNEIPGATVRGPDTEPQLIAMANSTIGQYTLDILGTSAAAASGSPFAVLLATVGTNGSLQGSWNYSGTATPGSSQRITVQIGPGGEINPSNNAAPGFLGLPGYAGYLLIAGIGAVVVVVGAVGLLRRRGKRRSGPQAKPKAP